MPNSATQQTEERLAKERNKNLEDGLIAKRRRYIALAVLFVVSACGIAVTGFWMIALSALVLGLICLLQYFDANGNLHEVRRRSTRTLVPDFSVLRQPQGSTTSKSQSAPH